MLPVRALYLGSVMVVALAYAPHEALAMSDVLCKAKGGAVQWNGAHLKLCCQKGAEVLYCETQSKRTLGKRKKPTN